MPDPLLLDIPHSLLTPRLHLRTFRAGDGPRLYEAVAESQAELRRCLGHLPWVAEELTQDSAELRCRRCEAYFFSRADLPYLAFETATGQGYASEGVNALVDWAFAGLTAQRVELITDEANTASRRVAERCGFALEGVLRHAQRAPDGSLRNTCVYARLPGDQAPQGKAS